MFERLGSWESFCPSMRCFSSKKNEYWKSVNTSRLQRPPPNIWVNNPNYTKQFVEWLGKQLSVKKLDDWYQIKRETFEDYTGAAPLQNHFGDSPSNMLKTVYPDHKWEPWKFSDGGNVRKYWKETENQKEYLNWLATQLGIQKMEDWYDITLDQVKKNEGFGLIKATKATSVHDIMKSAFPDQKWLLFQFKDQVPRGYWEDLANKLEYFDWLAVQLGVKTKEDWYSVTKENFIQHYGNTIMAKFGNSPAAALQDVYPQHHWLPWKFNKLPLGYWEDIRNQKEFMDWLSEDLKIKDLKDWYKVSLKQIRKASSGQVFSQQHFVDLLVRRYPKHNWDMEKLSAKRYKASQGMLLGFVKQIFPEMRNVIQKSLLKSL